jgi:hypothetical protein
MKNQGAIAICELRVPQNKVGSEYLSATGYGRDLWEARAHGGWPERESEFERIETALVRNHPGPEDQESERICRAICDFHIEEDEAIPDSTRKELKTLRDARQYADAVLYCFDEVWDGDYEV